MSSYLLDITLAIPVRYHNFWSFFCAFAVPDKRRRNEIEGVLIASTEPLPETVVSSEWLSEWPLCCIHNVALSRPDSGALVSNLGCSIIHCINLPEPARNTAIVGFPGKANSMKTLAGHGIRRILAPDHPFSSDASGIRSARPLVDNGRAA